jgi:hypothetical protein
MIALSCSTQQQFKQHTSSTINAKQLFLQKEYASNDAYSKVLHGRLMYVVHGYVNHHYNSYAAANMWNTTVVDLSPLPLSAVALSVLGLCCCTHRTKHCGDLAGSQDDIDCLQHINYFQRWHSIQVVNEHHKLRERAGHRRLSCGQRAAAAAPPAHQALANHHKQHAQAQQKDHTAEQGFAAVAAAGWL